MMDNIKMDRNMVKATTTGLMEVIMMGYGKIIRLTAMENTTGRMEEVIRVNG